MSDEEKYVPIYLEGEAGTLKLKMPKILEESISEKGFSDFNDKRYDDLLNRVEDERKDVQNRVLMLVNQANKKAKEAQKQQLDVLKNASKNLATIQEARTAFKIANNKLKEEIEKIEAVLKNKKINNDLTKEQKKKLQSELKSLRVGWKANMSQLDYLKKFTQSYKLAGVQIGAISVKHIDGIIKHIVFEFEKLKIKLAELRSTGKNKVINLYKRSGYVAKINSMFEEGSELQKRISEINIFTISKSKTVTNIQNEEMNDLLDKTSAKLKDIFIGVDSRKKGAVESAENVSKEMSEFEKNLGNIQGFNSMSDNDKKTITNACRIYLAAALINEPQFRKRLVELKTHMNAEFIGLIVSGLAAACFGMLMVVSGALGVGIGVMVAGIMWVVGAASMSFAVGALKDKNSKEILGKSLIAPKTKQDELTKWIEQIGLTAKLTPELIEKIEITEGIELTKYDIKKMEDKRKKIRDKLKKELDDAIASAEKLKVTKENKKSSKDIADLRMQLEKLNKTAKEQATSYEKQIKIKDDEIKKLIYEIKVLKGKVD